MSRDCDSLQGLPRLTVRDNGDAFASALGKLRDALAEHPRASSALLHALASQGRAYAATEEGQQQLRQLASSELVRRASLVWRASAARSLEIAEGDYLPEELMDAVFGTASRDDMEDLVENLAD